MYYDEEMTEVMGAYCTLIIAHKGHREGQIVGDYGNEYVVRLTNGKEIVANRDELIIYE